MNSCLVRSSNGKVIEVIAMAHLHPYYAGGSMEPHALPVLTNSDSKMLAYGHRPLTEQTPEWHWFLSLHLLVIILTSLYFTTNLRSWFCKELQLFRRRDFIWQSSRQIEDLAMLGSPPQQMLRVKAGRAPPSSPPLPFHLPCHFFRAGCVCGLI